MYTLSPLEYLDSLLIDYTLIPHEYKPTAQETAEAAHIKGRDLSKVIVVGAGQLLSMVVVPANAILLQTDLSRILKAPDLTIVPEGQFIDRFPECEVGAMPPFGKLYDMDVFLAKELANKEYITFNGGSHSLLIKMRTAEYIRLAGARVISLGYRDSVTPQQVNQSAHNNNRWL